MSVSYYILSPRPAGEMAQIERECQQALDDFLEEHECDDECGEVTLGGWLPTPEEALRGHAEIGAPPPDLARLAACKSVISIDRPAGFDNPLQVSMLRFLLERAGAGFILYVGFPLETAEVELRRLARTRAHKSFGQKATPRKARRPVKRRPERPGELRSVRVIQTMEAAREDGELAVEVQEMFRSLPVLAQKYALLLLDEGPMTDRNASQRLGVDKPTFDAMTRALDDAMGQR